MLVHRNRCWHMAFLVAGLLGVSSSLQAQSAHLTLHSQPGDFIGQGKDFDIFYTPANSNNFSTQISNKLPTGEPTYLTFILGTVTAGSDNTFTTIDFGTDKLNIPLQPGTYLDA